MWWLKFLLMHLRSMDNPIKAFLPKMRFSALHAKTKHCCPGLQIAGVGLH
jgi:hypothetical protein